MHITKQVNPNKEVSLWPPITTATIPVYNLLPGMVAISGEGMKLLILTLTFIFLAFPAQTFPTRGTWKKCYKVKIVETERGTQLSDIWFPCFCREVPK